MTEVLEKVDKYGAEENKKTCFIITPIGNDNSEIRRHAEGVIDECIVPLFKDEYDIIVAHRISETGSITKQVIQRIYDADIVIANLTGLNPNVMYELAFRHATKKPVIVIAEEGTQLPFDIATERTIFYRNDMHGALDLKNRLKVMLPKAIDGGSKYADNPIYDSLSSLRATESILENIGDSKDVDALKYILNRLDNIESTLQKKVSNANFVLSTENVGKTKDYDANVVSAAMRKYYLAKNEEKLSDKKTEKD